MMSVSDLHWWDFLTGIIIVAIVYSLVRPGSNGGQAVKDISTALIAIVGTATGYTTNNGGTGTGATGA